MKAIVAAGGFGTRLLPITKAVPKALLPLGGKPLIQHVVEELVAAGVRELAVLYRRDTQQCIRDHFFTSSGLQNHLVVRGTAAMLATTAEIDNLADINFIECDSAETLGEAILLTEAFVTGPTIVALCDEFGEQGPSVVQRMIRLHNDTECAVAAYQKSEDLPHLIQCVETLTTECPERRIVGRYLITVEFFRALRRAARTNGRAEFMQALDYIARDGKLIAAPVTGHWWNCNSHKVYQEAFVRMLLADHEIDNQ